MKALIFGHIVWKSVSIATSNMYNAQGASGWSPNFRMKKCQTGRTLFESALDSEREPVGDHTDCSSYNFFLKKVYDVQSGDDEQTSVIQGSRSFK